MSLETGPYTFPSIQKLFIDSEHYIFILNDYPIFFMHYGAGRTMASNNAGNIAVLCGSYLLQIFQ